MTSSTRSRLTTAQRAASLADAAHSAALEGLTITPATSADADQYVRGDIDVDELVRRVQARYGVA